MPTHIAIKRRFHRNAGLIYLPVLSQKEVDFRKKSDLKSNKAVSLPLNGMHYVTSGFGERYHPVYHKEIFHNGIDLKADYKIVKTIANGIIAKEGYDKRAGNYLIIQHGNRIESIYCHLNRVCCLTMRTSTALSFG